MFQRSTFTSPLGPALSGRDVNTAFFTGLLLLLLLNGCKTASTPTQTQTPAQPQSQASEAQAPQSAYPVSGNTQPTRSDDEIMGDFDAELDASIAVFDGMILEERAKAEAIEASLGGGQAGGEQGGGADGGSGGEDSLFEDGDIYEGLPGYGEFPEGESDGDTQEAGNEGDGSGAGSTASADTSDSDSADEGSATSPGGLKTTRRGGIPEDIDSGSDDDIVARQIREAALKEKDPVLREKLWDEYRQYKNQ